MYMLCIHMSDHFDLLRAGSKWVVKHGDVLTGVTTQSKPPEVRICGVLLGFTCAGHLNDVTGNLELANPLLRGCGIWIAWQLP